MIRCGFYLDSSWIRLGSYSHRMGCDLDPMGFDLDPRNSQEGRIGGVIGRRIKVSIEGSIRERMEGAVGCKMEESIEGRIEGHIGGRTEGTIEGMMEENRGESETYLPRERES